VELAVTRVPEAAAGDRIALPTERVPGGRPHRDCEDRGAVDAGADLPGVPRTRRWLAPGPRRGAVVNGRKERS
jgi:hypothetical protein